MIYGRLDPVAPTPGFLGPVTKLLKMVADSGYYCCVPV